MADLILHHYPMSPFAEKIRLVLGYKQLDWKSVHIPSIMPKPDVQALTGGYRRTPLLQVGADIYCDTALICDVLEHLAPGRSLYPAHLKGVARILAQWADTTLFTAAMAYCFQGAGAAELFANTPAEAARAFAQDRAQMAAGDRRLRPGDATSAYRSYLRRLANMLEDHPFLLGDAPTVADFAVYNPLWFTRRQVPSMAGILQATPAVVAWLDRMEAFGHGSPERLSSGEAIATAASSAPLAVEQEVFQDDHGVPLGSQVTVAAESFGTEPTQGELVAATRMHYTVRRVDERAGTVHVHFPRVGYVLRAVR